MNEPVVVLAAGKGTRMHSSLPKVLHPVCGKPMISYPITALKESGLFHTIHVSTDSSEIAELVSDSL